jgi:short-subunit dehydrogenase
MMQHTSGSQPGGAALITGASGGIGLELAQVFASNGHQLVLVARSARRLEELAATLRQRHGVTVTVEATDLASPAAPQEIYETLKAQGISIEVLVNNAGYALYGPFAETDLASELDMIQLNVNTLTALTKLFLHDMLARKAGKILNLASTAGFQPGPLMAVYYATKAYVLSFSEALANELAGSGVSVTALCPGPTRSGFQSRAKMEDSKLFSGKIMDAGTVARIGYQGLMQGKTVVVPGLRNRLLVQVVRITPRKLVARTARSMQERVHTS